MVQITTFPVVVLAAGKTTEPLLPPQDEGVGLCEAELDTNSTCALNAGNTFHGYFSEKCKAPLDEYPACVCKVRFLVLVSWSARRPQRR